MQELLNTLFVTSHPSYLKLKGETVCLHVNGTQRARLPLHHFGSIVCFGNVLMSPALITRCASDGRSIVMLDRNGRFRARVEGPRGGNVLLRQAQYAASGTPDTRYKIARAIVAGKIQNSRTLLVRAAREDCLDAARAALKHATKRLAGSLQSLRDASDLDVIRGIEGEAARTYFQMFRHILRRDPQTFDMVRRTRRPPRDPINAALSFVYTLLLNDCISAAEGVGLDAQVGFLHAIRPGRPALALDLMEELRPYLADRLVITLINRQQLTERSFCRSDGETVLLNEDGRKAVISAYHKRKQEKISHPMLEEPVQIGLIPHIQSRLIARRLRGDLEEYLPFLNRS